MELTIDSGVSTLKKMSRITAVAASAATVGLIGAPIAAAEADTYDVGTQHFGSTGKLVDGTVIQEWTITDLKPSSDVIPHPVQGTLWEATATDQAVQGSATPIISNFNARANNGQTYRVLFGAATAQGVNPATLAEGQQTTGKIYFDVTGEAPDSVVYNAGGIDRLVWEGQAPSSAQSAPSRSYPVTSTPAQSPASAAPAATPAEAAPAATAEEPAATGSEVAAPTGSQGTPLPSGSTGTPLPEGAQGTPIPAGEPAVAPGAEAAPVPASVEGTPAGASAGTPLPEGTEPVPTPSTYAPAP